MTKTSDLPLLERIRYALLLRKHRKDPASTADADWPSLRNRSFRPTDACVPLEDAMVYCSRNVPGCTESH